MRQRLMEMGLSAAMLFLVSSQPVWAENATFKVDPEAGNNTFSAVFDAALGERIMAVTSGIDCTVTVDEGKLGKAKCSVPLKSIKVDNDDTKTEHF
jgi:polyisoprenoid-binding protein YceI